MCPRSGFSFRGNMRTYPRSGFRSGRTSECTLVPVSVPGEHPPKPPWIGKLLFFGTPLFVVFVLLPLRAFARLNDGIHQGHSSHGWMWGPEWEGQGIIRGPDGFHCELCNKGPMTVPLSVQSHVGGKDHKKRLAARFALTIPSSTQTLPTRQKMFGGTNSCKDYSMITDWNVSQIVCAKITEIISKTSVNFGSPVCNDYRENSQRIKFWNRCRPMTDLFVRGVS